MIAERTLGKRKKPTLDLGRPPDESVTTSIPGRQRTLNKRRRPNAPVDAPAEQMPAGEAPAGGLSIFSYSTVPPAPSQPAPAPEVSELMAGTYATRVAVRDQQCEQPIIG